MDHMTKIGPFNSLTDVDGLLVGHYTDLSAACGVTVVLTEQGGAVAGVDVRGAAPGTRETDLLSPINMVQEVQAVVLSGGSVYGLSASDGVVRWLAEAGRGFPLGESQVAPIVPAAVLFDLGRGKDFVPGIGPEWGRLACQAARSGPLEMGTVGAGTGAQSGGIKGGFGTASQVLASGLTVAAAVAVNSLGSVIDPRTGLFWELGLEMDGEFGRRGHRAVRLPQPPEGAAGQNTTLAVVATDAVLSKVQVSKIAQMAHDGLARSIRPAHTMYDGDTVFALATGKKQVSRDQGFFLADQARAVNEIGHAAADCLSRAIIRAVLTAATLAGFTAHGELDEIASPV